MHFVHTACGMLASQVNPFPLKLLSTTLPPSLAINAALDSLLVGAQPVQCTACKGAVLCSPACATAAASDPGSHCGFVCKAISACNMNGLSDDDCSAIQYLLRAASLKLSAINGDENAKSRYETLLRLASLPQAHSEYQQQPTVVQKELHGRIVHVLQTLGVNPGVISLEDTVELLNRDTVNGFGILLPALGPEVSSL